MFYSRNKEIDMMRKKINSDFFEFIVLYGRRRVGKTALLNELFKDKKIVFFAANKESESIALERFSDSVLQVSVELSSILTKFESWDIALEYIFQNDLTLVIDEFPYLASHYNRILTLLQNLIDKYHKTSKSKIILCGSSMSFMERQILGYESPLYGRRTAQLKLKPFTFGESKPFFSHFTIEEQFIAYSIFGGIPYYLVFLNKYSTLKEAVIDLLLVPIGHLYEEPMNLLLQELREPTQYNGILDAIATGYTKHNEIATKVKMDSAKCSKYLRTLQDIHIIEKTYPDKKEKKNKAVYSILDPLFRFWYRYIPKYRGYIETDKSDFLYNEIIEKDISEYMGYAFEEICRQYLKKHLISEQYPWQLIDVKRWWGNNPIEKREEEIDLVGWNNEAILFAECKWTNEKIGTKIYNDLKRKSTIISNTPFYYVLFSKSGFSDEIIKLNDPQLYLVDLETILSF
jgi:AAA+ ATPase superfamily predicted ATPase